MFTRRLITTNQPRPRTRPYPECIAFARFLGRRLSASERVVISRLERQRYTPSFHRPLMVIDRGHNDSTQLLTDYLRFRLAASPSFVSALQVTPDTVRPKKKDKRLTRITYRQVNSIRGTNHTFILLLNAQDARSYSPCLRRPEKFRAICKAIFPMLSDGFIIIHLRAEKKPHHHPAITECDYSPPQPLPQPPSVEIVTLTSLGSVLSPPSGFSCPSCRLYLSCISSTLPT